VGYESFSVSEVIPAEPERIYAAWLSSKEHTAFTGDRARIQPFVGGKHSALAGYAAGVTVELLPGRRIVQTWRATDFPPGSPDSRVEVTLEETVGGTMVTIFHTEIPIDQGDAYRAAWQKYYLDPLASYFTNARAKKPAQQRAKKRPAKKSVAKRAKKLSKKPAPRRPKRSKKPAPKRSKARGTGAKPAPRKR
jgi:uncharacterized protein YndB with AHSA1/START domain